MRMTHRHTSHRARRDPVLTFYKALAPHYQHQFADWQAVVAQQSEVLDRLLRDACGNRALEVLDAACGIGTQALGLATKGHRVVATDLSSDAIEIAIGNASRAGLDGQVQWHVLSWSRLHTLLRRFDVVCACDNALPHLQTREAMMMTLAAMRDRLVDGGVLLASTRDYDRARVSHQPDTPPRAYDSPEGERILFQIWDWRDDVLYLLRHFMLLRRDEGWMAQEFQVPYRAWTRGELSELLCAVGFTSVRWLMPEQTQFFQPIVLARRQGGAPS
jgi:glycine/sarcosine N-methyltransferase